MNIEIEEEESFMECYAKEFPEKEYKTPANKRLYKKVFYKENCERIRQYNLNSYYIKKYGKSRDDIRTEKETKRKMKLESQLARLATKMQK